MNTQDPIWIFFKKGMEVSYLKETLAPLCLSNDVSVVRNEM